MLKHGCAALLAAALAIAPAAHAGDFFVNGQAGRIELDNAFGDRNTNLLQASAGYRWGLDNVQVGIEGCRCSSSPAPATPVGRMVSNEP